jgi:hypothetical protein
MSRDRIRQENKLLEELALEMPEKLLFSEAGTVLQDYIKAYVRQFSPVDNDLGIGSSYISHLLYAVVERVNKNSRTIN